MKIALVSFDFPEYCIRHANVMAEEHDVLLLLPENQMNGCKDLIDPNVKFVPFHKARFRQPFKQVYSIQRILSRIRGFGPDVVHFQHGHMFFNAFLPFLRRYPLVVTIHDPRQHIGDMESKKVPQWLMDFGYRSGHRNIVHGAELVDTVHKQIRIPRERIHVIPHIAIGQPQSCEAREERGLRVLFFGRIWEYKGLRYLIESEPLVSQAFPEVRFVIGGQGEEFDRYQNMMVHPERFEVHNEWISDEMRSRLFSEASIVVLPYIEATQSGVVPIAYSHQKPVIATRVGGLPEIVEHGKTGLLVEPRDANGLAEAIKILLADPTLRRTMGQAGEAKLREECDPHVVVKRTLEVYKEAINDRGLRSKQRHIIASERQQPTTQSKTT